MLVIRMQRTGRKGHAQFRVVVQDSRRTPTSGKIVAQLGHYDPHSKQTVLDKDKASFYLEHGAQPSPRAARLLKSEGVKLPAWLKLEGAKSRSIRNPEKLRRNRPAETQPADEPSEASAEDGVPVELSEVPVTPEAEPGAAVDEPAAETPEEKVESASEAATAGAESAAESTPARATAAPESETEGTDRETETEA